VAEVTPPKIPRKIPWGKELEIPSTADRAMQKNDEQYQGSPPNPSLSDLP
jgi:hypothetical protein